MTPDDIDCDADTCKTFGGAGSISQGPICFGKLKVAQIHVVRLLDEARPRNVGESTLALWQPAGVMLLEMAAEQERVQRNLLNEKSLFSSFFMILTNTLFKAKQSRTKLFIRM